MNLAELLGTLQPTESDPAACPLHLLGAFRRKSITFCNGTCDETTQVFWFQSQRFTIDLRLSDAEHTAVGDRQGWIGDTVWDPGSQQLLWRVARSYQPRNQWPEPAILHTVGNSVLEFAPSGAYVEDWRQQCTQGPLLGLRLLGICDQSGALVPRDGGLVLAGEHMAFAQSRAPLLDDRLIGAETLDETGLTQSEIESYEVSVAIGGETVTHSTQPHRRGERIVTDSFAREPDGIVSLQRAPNARLLFTVDCYVPDFAFATTTACTSEAEHWLERERSHLLRHARMVR